MYGSSFFGCLFINWTDLIITPFYIYLFYQITKYIANKYYKDDIKGKILIQGYWVKVFGSLAISFIYEFYYKGGDVEGYFWGSRGIYDSLFSNPMVTVKLFFITPDKIKALQPNTPEGAEILQYIISRHFLSTQELTTIKVAALASFFNFHTYTAMGIFFSMFSFAGSWKVFTIMSDKYPALVKEFSIACFYIPSVVFWGSGILKDPITYGGLCFSIYYIFEIFVRFRFSIFKLFFLGLNVLLVLLIKPYIFLCLLPAILLFVMITNIQKVNLPILKILFFPIFVVLFFGITYLMANSLKDQLGKYAIENLTGTMESFQEWHNAEALISGGSAYNLGNMDYSTWGIIKKFPLAVNVTFFRPYLWESHKPIIFLSAIESLFMTLFVLRIVYRIGIINFFRVIGSDPFIIFCMMFSLVFGFAVGISSYNFGALVRYKIPCMSFFLIGLYLIDYRSKQKKLVQKKRNK